MNFAAVISGLKARVATTNERLAKLAERRRPYALDAVIGDAKAKRAIEKIDADADAARNEAETLTVAIEEAEKRRAEYEARLVSEVRRRREAGARSVCAAILEADREFDEAAKRLCQSLASRQELVRKVAALDVIYPGVVNALRRKQHINAALAYAGLQQFADMPLGPPNCRKPLAELDASLGNPIMSAIEASAAMPPRGRAEHEIGPGQSLSGY